MVKKKIGDHERNFWQSTLGEKKFKERCGEKLWKVGMRKKYLVIIEIMDRAMR